MATEKPTKPPVDWEAVELDYRAGILTLRQMAEKHGVSHPAIKKRADKGGWTRDLAAKIQATADALVTREAVTKTVTAEAKVTEQAVIDANAQAIYTVRMSHREGAKRSKALVMQLMDEVEAETGNRELFERLGELLDETTTDANGNTRQDKLNEIYRKVISMPGRVDATKRLVETFERLVSIERVAFGMSADDVNGKGMPTVIIKDYTGRG